MIFKRKWIASLLAASVLTYGSVVYADARADAQAALKRGVAALDKGDPRTARVELMNAIKADPNLAAARVAQARAQLMLGNGNGAQSQLERAISLGAQPGPIRHLLAHAALLQGRMVDALEEARASDSDPNEKPFLARLAAQALQGMGEHQRSAFAYERALELAPDDAALWGDIARFHIATGDMAKALSATDRAVALAPDNVDVLTLRALMAREQYGLRASIQWFEAALKKDRSHVPALVEYAATLADMGKAGGALSLTRRALGIAPGNARAFFIQAVIAARAGDYGLARGLLSHTKGRLDGRAATRLLRGVLHMKAGNATLAVGELEPVLEAQPLNIEVRLLLARAHYDDGQYVSAERVLFPIVERGDASSYALHLAARIHEAIGNRVIAAEFAQRASRMEIEPSTVYRGAGRPEEVAAAANANLALAGPNIRYIRALMEAGKNKDALTRARALADANPGAPPAILVLGDCLMVEGRYAEAAETYERAANLRFRENVALRIVDAWKRAGDAEKATRALDLFLAQNPMSIDGKRLAATYYMASGNLDKSLILLKSLQEALGNEDALLMTNMARVWIAKGDAQRALPYAAHAYRLKPMSAVSADILGWALYKAQGRSDAAIELLEKAAMLAPQEAVVKQHLAEAKAG